MKYNMLTLFLGLIFLVGCSHVVNPKTDQEKQVHWERMNFDRSPRGL